MYSFHRWVNRGSNRDTQSEKAERTPGIQVRHGLHRVFMVTGLFVSKKVTLENISDQDINEEVRGLVSKDGLGVWQKVNIRVGFLKHTCNLAGIQRGTIPSTHEISVRVEETPRFMPIMTIMKEHASTRSNDDRLSPFKD
jgi:hypothetical protein